jgi:hypothetical protein
MADGVTVTPGDLVTWFDEQLMCPRVGRVKLVRRVDAIVSASDHDRIVPLADIRILKNGPATKRGQTALEVRA